MSRSLVHKGKAAFNSWEELDFPLNGNDTRIALNEKSTDRTVRNFLEADKIRKLHNAANSDEKLFWKLLKGKRCSSQMGAFLVSDNLLIDKNLIREMWADHFEALGTPSENAHFDNGFLDTVCCQKCPGDLHFLYQRLHWSFKPAS